MTREQAKETALNENVDSETDQVMAQIDVRVVEFEATGYSEVREIVRRLILEKWRAKFKD